VYVYVYVYVCVLVCVLVCHCAYVRMSASEELSNSLFLIFFS
jgi:hypothetical protein